MVDDGDGARYWQQSDFEIRGPTKDFSESNQRSPVALQDSEYLSLKQQSPEIDREQMNRSKG